MNLQEILTRFHEIASDPKAQKEKYLKDGKKLVLVSYYTPEEIVHAMGAVPFGVWGGDFSLSESKKYFPAFICSIVQSLVELGIKGVYDGASAIIIPSLCDSLKVVGENWKAAVPGIKFIPMTYPQNRKPDFGIQFTRAGYERVIGDLEAATGLTLTEEKLLESIRIYNEHNRVMREVTRVLSSHPQITNQQRSDIFKSAFFLLKDDHTALVKELIDLLSKEAPTRSGSRIMTSGILADAPGLLSIFDENSLQIVCDDVAAESRQYKTDTPEDGVDALDRLARKFAAMDDDTLLYDPKKHRVEQLISDAKANGANGLVVVMTKFCDPEEFDYPLIKKAADAAELPCLHIEVDRQMVDFAQARTAIETFRELL